MIIPRKRVARFKDPMKEGMRDLNKSVEEMKGKISQMESNLAILFAECRAYLSERSSILQEIKSTNETVSDTLLNVLLAIRQNEYLQAWYPPQKGFDAMKVTGTHPANLPRKSHGQKNTSH